MFEVFGEPILTLTIESFDHFPLMRNYNIGMDKLMDVGLIYKVATNALLKDAVHGLCSLIVKLVRWIAKSSINPHLLTHAQLKSVLQWSHLETLALHVILKSNWPCL